MTARQKTLAPGHRVSVRSGSTSRWVQDTTIDLAAGDSLTINGTVVVPPPPPPVTPPPTSGIPQPPSGAGTVLLKNFADGHMGFPGDATKPLFVPQTYNNEHPGQPMVQYEQFVTTNVSVHDGYMDLRCTRNANGIWSASLVSTSLANSNTRTFDVGYGTVRWMARMNYGKGAWTGLWQWRLWGLGAECEIDAPELIASRLTVNIHGTSYDGQVASLPPPDNGWHEYAQVRTSSYIALLVDGVEKARWAHAMPERLCLLADCKVGLEAPDASTPSPLFLHVAWITVD